MWFKVAEPKDHALHKNTLHKRSIEFVDWEYITQIPCISIKEQAINLFENEHNIYFENKIRKDKAKEKLITKNL